MTMQKVSSLVSSKIGDTLTNMQNWGNVFYNVNSYGIYPDGTDVTNALQTLVNLANSEGRTAIFFPHGDYLVTFINNDEDIYYFGDNADFVGGYTKEIVQLGSPPKDSTFTNVKDYGAKGDGTTDDTVAINNSCNASETVIFPEGTYKTNSALTNIYKSRLIGDGKLKSNVLDNWYTNSSKVFKGFSEKVNSFGKKSASITNPFRQTNLAFSQNRDINICCWGDSITVTGNEVGSAKFKSRVSANSGSLGKAYAPDGITKEDSYVLKFMDMLMKKFPSQGFNLFNYAIGGTTLSQWNTNKTFESTTKAWINFIKDSKPDLLIIGFGMNHSSFAEATGFSFYQKKVMDYIKANFSPMPDVVFVTTPRCINVPGNAEWGTFLQQALRMNAANVCRTMALEQGAYVCDVGRISDIKRTGLDYLQPISKKVSISDFNITLSGVTNNLNGTYTFSGSGGNMILKGNYLKDFTLRFTLNFNVVNVGSENDFTVHFNKIDAGQTDNRVVFNPKEVTVASLNSYLRIGDYVNWNTDGGFLTGNYNFSSSLESQDVIITISKYGSVVDYKIGSGETRVLRDCADVVDVPGWLQFDFATGGSSSKSCVIKNIEIFGTDYTNYSQAITDDEMYGGFVSGDYGVKQPYGGNGANHPSSIGVQECYVPCMRELVDDISKSIVSDDIKNNYNYFPVTETKASINVDGTFSAIDMGLVSDYPIFTARVISPSSVVYKLNNTVNSFSDAVARLQTNEFGIYNNADHLLIVLKTAAASGFQVTTYKNS